MASSALLAVNDITRQFGGVTALKRVTFAVAPGEILALIGPNGAGKTTMFNIIAGSLPPSAGEIRFKGRAIKALAPERRCRLGIARTFQIPRPFLPMSVADNLRVGAIFGHHKPSRDVDGVVDLLVERLDLKRWRDAPAETLPLGARKKLELARALSTGPDLLLLDEVMGGLSPGEIGEVMSLIRSIRQEGITVVFVEHVMRAVMGLADRIIVLRQGEIISEGAPEAVSNDPKVIAAYIGGGLVASPRA
jgi:ABC-type branched-subunit amino acid transport system ATPase component